MRVFVFGIAVLCFVIGVFAGMIVDHSSVSAQAEQGAWEISHGAFGQQSFYVIKHNRITGETLELSGARGATDDAWLKLPEEDKTSKKR
jgi:hypothetical protein